MAKNFTKKSVQPLLDRLAHYHFEEMGHPGYHRCDCVFSSILRDLAKVVARKQPDNPVHRSSPLSTVAAEPSQPEGMERSKDRTAHSAHFERGTNG